MKLSLRNKVVGLAVLAALVPLVATVTLTIIEKRPLQERVLSHMNTFAQGEVEQTAKQVYLMCKIVRDGTARHLLATLNVAKEEISRSGGITLSKESVAWKARNQFTQKITNVSLPKMMVGEVWLGQNAELGVESPVVDVVTKHTQKYCTIFQRMNADGDMIRVCTTVHNDEGKRAIGTYIPSKMSDGTDNPVLAKVLKGDRYSAMAQVVGKFQETVYEPIWKGADKKEIIGMVYVGSDMNDVLKELRDAIQSIVVGKTGYVCVVGAKGEQRGCYIISKGGERNGENILDTRDANGRAIIKDVVDKALTTPSGTVFFDQYPWQNKGEVVPRIKRAALVYYEPWDWVINAGVCDDEYHGICQNIESAIDKLITNTTITGGLFMVAVVILALFLGGAVAKPIRKIADVAQMIARGDLAEAKRKVATMGASQMEMAGPQGGRLAGDETTMLSVAITAMTSHLASLVGQVQKSCVQLVSASTEIAATSKEQEATVGEFEALTARIVTAVKEISATAQELAKTMEGVRGVAEGTGQLADSGRAGLGNMEGTMKQLAEATTSISSKLSVISEKAGNINSVVTTITKVADQTNLLSLNAAIEAEKAGEYGLGFAVVAREIRRLADQTAVATLDIEAMVKEMQSSVTVGVMEMDKFSEEVKRGVRTVGEISGQMGQIIERVKEVTGQFEKVNEGMKAQSQGAEQISEAMVHLSEGAKQTTESVKQSNEATEQLREAARALQTETSRFKV
ncbi:MAG: methyl-accepting chemotaxis protein [Verrucomicrobia bacterium]|nr:methyl-accepting chemotaxis protein [Verrucomicrobiota bacterium]